jgi:alpha 1,3-glucosidase
LHPHPTPPLPPSPSPSPLPPSPLIGLYIKTKDGSTFDGWCWPGSSSYLDFTSPSVRDWWATQFRLDKYIGSTLDLFTWNDMNEPSVFNGPEVSMPKDATNLKGVEHREWHNLYGIYMQMATALGLTMRSPGLTVEAPPLRPFVLTRSFWAGSQRYGAMWTGDNKADWSHLQIAAPMLLSINLGGLSFAGADVGGFFGDPDAELFTRWYQAGAFTPFFRGHAHLDTKRREPWVFGEPYTSVLRSAAMLRYSLLPYWYSTFYEGYATGMPVMRPLFLEFPEDESTYAMDSQWMVGSALLVAPVTQRGQTSVHVYLPAGTEAPLHWYDLETLQALPATAPGTTTEVQAPLAKVPVFVRAGSIVPRKMRLRRSAKLMRHDPYTLVVAPSDGGAGGAGSAEGLLYLDDEETLAHEVAGRFALRQLRFSEGVLSCSASSPLLGPSVRPSSIGTSTQQVTVAATVHPFVSVSTVERVLLAGQSRAPKGATLRYTRYSAGTGLAGEAQTQGAQAEEAVVQLLTSYDPLLQVVTVKKPDVLATQDWTLTLHY